ncbi:hypothetical protein VPH35_066150 [Triticum aestivum]
MAPPVTRPCHWPPTCSSSFWSCCTRGPGLRASSATPRRPSPTCSWWPTSSTRSSAPASPASPPPSAASRRASPALGASSPDSAAQGTMSLPLRPLPRRHGCRRAPPPQDPLPGDHADNTVVLVVPYACCGVLIGKGGTLIKSLAEAVNAGITVSHHRVCYGFNDRLVKITALIPCGGAPPAVGVVPGLPVPDSWPCLFNWVP